MAQYDVVWSAPLSGGASSIAVGDCVVRDSTGQYLIASGVNRASYGRAYGIATTAGDTSNPSVEIVVTGIVDESVTGLGTGTASWVRVSSDGVLERCTPDEGDDVVGWCETDGTMHCCFGVLSPATSGTSSLTSVSRGESGVAYECASMTSGSGVLTLASSTLGKTAFTSGDVGKAIQVTGAGTSGADLYTTIASYSSATSVTLTASAATTVSAQTAIWYPDGADDTTALQAILDATTADNADVWLPDAVYVISSPITTSSANHLRSLRGSGSTQTRIVPSGTSLSGHMIEVSATLRGFRMVGLGWKHVGVATSKTAPITNVAITSNVVTLTCANTFTAGDRVMVTMMTGQTYLNDQILTVATASATQFTAAFTHANVASTADTGFAFLDHACVAIERTSVAAYDVSFEDCVFMRAPGMGLSIPGAVGARLERCVALRNGGHGLAFHNYGSLASVAPSESGCLASGNYLAGSYYANCKGGAIEGCKGDRNGANFYVTGCYGLAFSGCESESALNRTTAAPAEHFRIRGGEGVSLLGCYATVGSGDTPAGNAHIKFTDSGNRHRAVGCVSAGSPQYAFSISSGVTSTTVDEHAFVSPLVGTEWSDSGTNSAIKLGGVYQTTVQALSTRGFSVGTTPATTGGLRLEASGSIKGRNAGNTADIAMLALDGANGLVLGDIANASTADVKALGAVALNANTAKAQITTAGTWAIGTTPATAGAVGLENNTAVNFRSAANDANYNLIKSDGSNGITVGATTSVGQVDVKSSSAVVLTASAYPLTLGSGYVSLSTTPSTTGALRLANNVGAYFRNAANSADILLIGSDSSNGITIGNTSTAGQVDVKSTSACVLTASTYKLTVGTSYVSLGTTPAASGAIRLENNVGIFYRKASNAADINMIASDTSDNITIGAVTGVTQIDVKSVTSIALTTGKVTIPGGSAALAMSNTPATAGTIRLSNTDAINFRNGANNADLNLIKSDSINRVTIGDASGGGVVLSPSSLSIGATPATTGALRLTNATGIYQRNAGNSADVGLITMDSSNAIVVGDVTNAATLDVKALGNLTFFANLAKLQLTTGGGLGIGTTPATAGALRLESGAAIDFRNQANNANLNLIKSDTSNNVKVGDTSGVNDLQLQSSGDIILSANSQTLTIDNAGSLQLKDGFAATYASGYANVAAVSGLLKTVDPASNTLGMGSVCKALSSDFTTTNATATSTNLTFAVTDSDIWLITFWLVWQTTDSNGQNFAIAAPSGATIECIGKGNATSATTWRYARVTAINTLTTVNYANFSPQLTPLYGFARVKMSGTSGSITIQGANVTAGQTLTIKAGSYIDAKRVVEV